MNFFWWPKSKLFNSYFFSGIFVHVCISRIFCLALDKLSFVSAFFLFFTQYPKKTTIHFNCLAELRWTQTFFFWIVVYRTYITLYYHLSLCFMNIFTAFKFILMEITKIYVLSGTITSMVNYNSCVSLKQKLLFFIYINEHCVQLLFQAVFFSIFVIFQIFDEFFLWQNLKWTFYYHLCT